MNYETAKEKFISLVKGIKCLSEETKNNILEYLASSDFYEAPASTRFHNNVIGGLLDHSIGVAEKLCELTKNNNLKWEREESPLIIGLFHDLCKIGVYDISYRNVKKTENGKDSWVKVPYYQFNDKDPLLGIHGDKSLAILLSLQEHRGEFTKQELSCIRFHMGTTQDGETQGFYNAISKDNLIYWTTVADNLTSLEEPICE